MNKKTISILISIILVLSAFTGVGLAAEEKKLDLNAATVEDLSKVPGLNPQLAEKMIKLREENGEFVDMEELLDVEGIDNNLLRALKQHIFINDVAGCNC